MRGVRNLGEIQGSNFSSIAGFGLTTEDTTARRGRRKEEQAKVGPKGEGAGATESKSTEGE